jgi:hypothetical protein
MIIAVIQPVVAGMVHLGNHQLVKKQYRLPVYPDRQQ